MQGSHRGGGGATINSPPAAGRRIALWLSVQELKSQNKALAEKLAVAERQLAELAGGSVGTDAR